MHIRLAALAVLSLAGSTAANRSCPRKWCKSNKCAAVVEHNPWGRADCSQNLHHTITQGTTTLVVTATAKITKTVTQASSAQAVVTTTATAKSTDTVASTSSVTVVTDKTITSFSTIATATTTSTTYSTQLIVKRDVDARWERRGVEASSQSENVDEQVPPYADHACDCAAYTSACACLGIHPSTTTLPGGTHTSTRTVTQTDTVEVTSDSTHTSTLQETVTDVETETLTQLSTVTQTSSVTLIQDTTATTTAITTIVPVPCTVFNIVIKSNGSFNGMYVAPASSSFGDLSLSSTAAGAGRYWIDSSSSHVYSNNGKEVGKSYSLASFVAIQNADPTELLSTTQQVDDQNAGYYHALSCTNNFVSPLACTVTIPGEFTSNAFFNCGSYISGIVISSEATISGDATYAESCTEQLMLMAVNPVPTFC